MAGNADIIIISSDEEETLSLNEREVDPQEVEKLRIYTENRREVNRYVLLLKDLVVSLIRVDWIEFEFIPKRTEIVLNIMGALDKIASGINYYY